jgi:hypothetical protein
LQKFHPAGGSHPAAQIILCSRRRTKTSGKSSIMAPCSRTEETNRLRRRASRRC